MATRGLNKVMLIGHLGRDPEVRYMPNGKAVANFSVATSESWNDKDSGEKKEQTEWHKIVVFGKLAEICGEYLSKGKQVYLEGRIQTREWNDKEGNKRQTTEIVVSDMQMLGGRGDDKGERPANSNKGSNQSKPQATPRQSSSSSEPPPQEEPPERGPDGDIPF